jgi:hypothetical protein
VLWAIICLAVRNHGSDVGDIQANESLVPSRLEEWEVQLTIQIGYRCRIQPSAVAQDSIEQWQGGTSWCRAVPARKKAKRGHGSGRWRQVA